METFSQLESALDRIAVLEGEIGLLWKVLRAIHDMAYRLEWENERLKQGEGATDANL